MHCIKHVWKNLLGMILCGAACAVMAQNPDSAKYQLQPVTVTALRYAEQALKVPLAITILNTADLQNVRGYGLDDVLKFVPGVLAQSRFGNQDIRITIRGFGARGAGDRSNAGTSRGIRVLLDGTPETEPDGRTSFDFIDLASAHSIEVIRSNASAVWGNAAGGVINISSVPAFDESFLTPQIASGNYGLRRYGLQAGTYMGSSKLALSVTNTTFDGWRANSSSERTLLNASLISIPGERTKIAVYLAGTENKFFIPGPLSQAQFEANPKQANATYLSRNERRHNRLGRIGLTLDHDLDATHGFSAITFIEPKFLQRSERGTFRDFNRYHVGGNLLYRFTHAFSASVRSKLQIGADEAYQDGAILFYSLSPTNERGATLQQNKREGANTFGAFIQEELSLGSALNLVLGARYNDVTYHSEDFINPNLQGKKSFSGWTPKAGLNYQLSPAHSLYVNFGKGIEVPAGNETDPISTFGQDLVYLINPLLEPIRSTTFEIGMKQIFAPAGNPLLRSLSYDLAVYRIKIKDDIIPYRGGRFYFTAGETRRQGIEIGATGRFDYGLSLRTALTFSSNKYVEYKVDSVHYSRPGKFADYGDNEVAGVPKAFYSAGLRFAPPQLGNAYVEIDVQGIGEYFVDDGNVTSVPAYNILNLTVGLEKPLRLSENFNLHGFVGVNNLSNKKYAASAFINPDIVGGVPLYLEPGLPRNYVIGISFSGSKTP